MDYDDHEELAKDVDSDARIYPISLQQYTECQAEAARVLKWARQQGVPELDCRIVQALAMAECVSTLLPPDWTPPPGFSY